MTRLVAALGLFTAGALAMLAIIGHAIGQAEADVDAHDDHATFAGETR